jgi:hypothetical protein
MGCSMNIAKGGSTEIENKKEKRVKVFGNGSMITTLNIIFCVANSICLL